MTDDRVPINNIAPLANVARLMTLVDRLQNRAHGLPGLGCFYGRAGLGKSVAGIFAANKFNACHVQVLSVGGTKTLMEMIVTELGLHPARTTAALFQQAAGEFARTGRPLIIDEADRVLRDVTIETIRDIQDHTGVPVILMGEELLPQKLQRWERVHSRVLSWVAADNLTIDDITHLAPIYVRGVTLEPALKQALLTASRGSIRNACNSLSNMAEFAALKGLTHLGIAAWGANGFHTGEAPEARRGTVSVAAMGRARRAG